MILLGQRSFLRSVFTWLVLLVFLLSCSAQPTSSLQPAAQPPSGSPIWLLPVSPAPKLGPNPVQRGEFQTQSYSELNYIPQNSFANFLSDFNQFSATYYFSGPRYDMPASGTIEPGSGQGAFSVAFSDYLTDGWGRNYATKATVVTLSANNITNSGGMNL